MKNIDKKRLIFWLERNVEICEQSIKDCLEQGNYSALVEFSSRRDNCQVLLGCIALECFDVEE